MIDPGRMIGTHPTAAGAPEPPPSLEARARILNALTAAHIPMRDAFLPNFDLPSERPGSIVSPGYHRSPAPIGIAAYGVTNVTGTAKATVLNTASFEGSTTFSNLSAFYLDDDAPWYVSEQLNAVLSNVTLFGNSSYAFWNQNVVLYSGQDHLLQFIDNVWNFSSPTFSLSSNAFNRTGPNGSLHAPVFYYGLGPVINISMPFTLHLFLNASTVLVRGHPDDIVWFNYSLEKAGRPTSSGSYDFVVFNSQRSPPVTTLPSPLYQLNGANLTPTGLLPWDAELVLGGPGGGSTTSVYSLNATMNLSYLPAPGSPYRSVPSAWNVGSETAETVEGVSTWYDASRIVHLGAGPTLLTPMWGQSPAAVPGYSTLTASVSPSNAFVFINASSTFNASRTSAAWAPVPPSGLAVYRLPPGNYAGVAEFSNYDPMTFYATLSVPTSWVQNLRLTVDPSRGIYTPLSAWGNSQLSAIARSGSGTPSDPYVLWNDQPGPLDALFGSFNDFGFPVFPGLFLAETSAHVRLLSPPSFFIQYAGPALQYTTRAGLPSTNHLQLELYAADNVSIWGGAEITGWFSGNLAGFPVASLMLWNSSSDLVAGNDFPSEGASMLLFDGTGNVIWGNRFEATSIPTTVAGAPNPIGLEMFSTGNLVFNNYFTAPDPALSPPFTIYVATSYGSNAALWADAWNVSPRPYWEPSVVNGFTLSGSIVGGSSQGGNYWSNYGTSQNPIGGLPYTNGGAIYFGGDFDPLLAPASSTATTLTFSSAGAPAGAVWTVSLNGFTETAQASSIVFPVTNGTYQYSVSPPPGWLVVPSSGSVTISGSAVILVVSWSPVVPRPAVTLTVEERGLPGGTPWSITVGPDAFATNASSVNGVFAPGTYPFHVGHVAGFTPNPETGNLTVGVGGSTLIVTFTAENGRISVTLESVPSGLVASVDGAPVALGSTGFSVVVPPGLHAIVVEAPGYLPYFNNVSVDAAGTRNLTVLLHAIPQAATNAAFPAAAWDVIGILVVLLALIGVGLLVLAARGPKPPSASGRSGDAPDRPPQDPNSTRTGDPP